MYVRCITILINNFVCYVGNFVNNFEWSNSEGIYFVGKMNMEKFLFSTNVPISKGLGLWYVLFKKA